MSSFYLVKYNPLFSERNWFRLWNQHKTQSLKVVLNPVDHQLTCYVRDREVMTINVTSLLQHQKSIYFNLTNTATKSTFYLPNNHKLHLNELFLVEQLETTIWVDVIAYQTKTRSQINSCLVDSLTGLGLISKDLENQGSESESNSDNNSDGDIDGDSDKDKTSDSQEECPEEIPQLKAEQEHEGEREPILEKMLIQTTADYDTNDSNKPNEPNEPNKPNKIKQTTSDNLEKRYPTFGWAKITTHDPENRLTPTTTTPETEPNCGYTLGPILEYLPIRLKKQLSFCQTCLGRLWQIQQTLPINLKHNLPLQDRVEFLVVDFGTPGLYEWITQHFTWALKIGYLRYLRTDKLSKWHASIAKNTSHYYARGEILTNLDCDNYTGKLGGLHVIKLFEKYGKQTILHQWSGIHKDGTYGRISCHRDAFLKLGGYDESFLPMGYQDHDLIMRLRLLYGARSFINYAYLSKLKSKYGVFPSLYSRAVENDKTDSMENTGYLKKIEWQQMNDINKHKSHENIIYGRYQVNRKQQHLGVFIY